MSRDWESQLYFPHQPLTPARLAALLTRLMQAGLTPTAVTADGERYPAMTAITADAGVVSVADCDIETLLRTKEPPLGPGYGVISLHCTEPWTGGGAEVFLSFSRPDAATGLDGVQFTIAGEAFRDSANHTVPEAFARCREWFALLAEQFQATYGWGDWEDISFAVAPPTRPQARAGQVSVLFRLNCLGATLAAGFTEEQLALVQHRRLTYGGLLVWAGMLYAESGTAERRAAAQALGLRPAAGFLEL